MEGSKQTEHTDMFNSVQSEKKLLVLRTTVLGLISGVLRRLNIFLLTSFRQLFCTHSSDSK